MALQRLIKELFPIRIEACLRHASGARYRHVRRLSRILTVGCLLSGASLWAGPGGSISGTVRDPSGAVVPRARIIATEISTHVSQTESTDSKGFYSFLSLPVGTYNVHAEAPGFGSYLRTNVVLDADGKAVVDATLGIGSVCRRIDSIGHRHSYRNSRHSDGRGNLRAARRLRSR